MLHEEKNILDGLLENKGNNLETSPDSQHPFQSLPITKECHGVRASIVSNEEERRISERQPVNTAAKARTPSRPEPVECIVLDISQTGARIELCDETITLSQFLRIDIPDLNIVVDCQQRWRHKNKVGLAFLFSTDEFSSIGAGL